MTTKTIAPIDQIQDTIAQALQRLAAYCDGAASQDNVGFNGADTEFGKRLAYRSMGGDLTPKQLIAAAKMLQKYRNTQLGGIDLPTLAEVEAVVGSASVLPDVVLDVVDGEISVKLNNAHKRKSQSNLVKTLATRRFDWNLLAWLCPPAHKDEILAMFPDAEQTDAFKALDGSQAPSLYRLELVKDRIFIHFPFDQAILDMVRTLPGRKWEKEVKGKPWSVPASAAVEVIRLFGDYDRTPEVEQAYQDALARFQAEQERKAIAQQTNAEDFQITGLNPGVAPYGFQQVGIQWLEAAGGSGIVGDDMGLGKTMQGIGYLAIHPEIRPAVIVVPAAVKINWQREISRFLAVNNTTHMIEGRTPEPLPQADIYLINYDVLTAQEKDEDGNPIIAGWVDALIDVKPQIVICDEAHKCFPYSTKVQTTEGEVSIGEIVESRRNWYVASWDAATNTTEYQKVTYRFKSEIPETMIRVVHERGMFECTPNHPIWVEGQGYVEAKDLRYGSYLRLLRRTISNHEAGQKQAEVLRTQLCVEGELGRSPGSSKARRAKESNYKNLWSLWREFFFSIQRRGSKSSAPFLRELLCSQMEDGATRTRRANQESGGIGGGISQVKGRHEKTGRSQTHEGKQPYEKPRSEEEDQSITTGAHFPFKGWEWQVDQATEIALFDTGMADNVYGVHNFDQRFIDNIQESANSLQRGSSLPKEQACNRSGWQVPQKEEMAVLGSTQNRDVELSRLVRVEVYQRRDHGKPRSCSGQDSFVYNIEVEKNHNYFITGGVLVSNCKNHKTIRTKAIKKLRKQVNRWIGLTGTPMDNKVIDLWQLLNFVDPQVWKNRHKFALRYCNAHRTRFGWDYDGASNLDELHEQIKPYMIRRMKRNVLADLPDKRRLTVAVELTGPARRKYDQLIADAKKEIESGKAGPARHLTLIEEAKQCIIDGKLAVCMEWIADAIENGEKMIVFATHRKTVETVAEKFGKAAVKIIGGMTSTQRQAAVDAFQEDESVRLCVANLDAGGVGLNLTAASNVVTLELGAKPSQHEQAEDRAWRNGQTKDVTAWYLLAVDTIEEQWFNIIEAKRQTSGEAIDGTTTGQGFDVYAELVEWIATTPLT